MRGRWFASSVAVSLACAACAASPRGSPSEPLLCPHDAVAAGGACRCAPGLTVLEGACVGARELDAYCAPLASRAGACVAASCDAGDALDLATGKCVAAQIARAIAAEARPIPDDLALGCREGRALVVRGDYVACVPFAETCPRGTTWDAAGARCVPVPACAPGEVREVREVGAAPACVRVVTRVSEGTPVVDVGRWSRAVLGTDGGEGTARLCRPLAQQLWGDDLGAGGARTLALTVELRFPDNDLTQLSAEVWTDEGGPAGASVQARRTTHLAEAAVAGLLVPFRALGGASDAASATIRIRCTVRGGGSPALFPR